MAWVLRARAPAARLIAASRSGLGVRRSALSGVRPSACCTPALHRRRAFAKAAHGAQLEAPHCAVPLEEAPAQKSKCSYACLRIRWHGSPCGPAVREVVHQFSVEGPRDRAFTKSIEMWYVQRPEELEDLSSYELLARYDNTGGKYHRLFVGPPMVPHYAPFLEARHSVPPGEFKRLTSAKDLVTSTRKHEEYCEQRLVMFRPYRQRLQLLDGHKSFSAAFFFFPPVGHCP